MLFLGFCVVHRSDDGAACRVPRPVFQTTILGSLCPASVTHQAQGTMPSIQTLPLVQLDPRKPSVPCRFQLYDRRPMALSNPFVAIGIGGAQEARRWGAAGSNRTCGFTKPTTGSLLHPRSIIGKVSQRHREPDRALCNKLLCSVC